MREMLVVYQDKKFVENIHALARLRGESRSSIVRKLIIAGCYSLKLPEPKEDNFISTAKKEI